MVFLFKEKPMEEPKFDIGEMVAKYIAIRDKKAELAEKHKQEMEPFNQAMAAIESVFHQQLDALGVENIKTSSGTIYKAITKSVKLADSEAFKQFVFEPDSPRWDMVDFRAGKKGILEYVEETGQLPPGISMDSFTTVNIRRS